MHSWKRLPDCTGNCRKIIRALHSQPSAWETGVASHSTSNGGPAYLLRLQMDGVTALKSYSDANRFTIDPANHRWNTASFPRTTRTRSLHWQESLPSMRRSRSASILIAISAATSRVVQSRVRDY